MAERGGGSARREDREARRGDPRCCCCQRTPRTRKARSSKSAPAPAAARRRCSQAICSACTRATPNFIAGRSRCSPRARARPAATRKSSRTSTGKGVFARLKFESGVHRVQRVPATEAQGRIHTSAATVAVLPEAEDVDVDMKPEDLEVETLRASSKGGQHANTTDSAVRMTHMPTGMTVTVSSRSQHQNRAQALQVMRSRLYEVEREKLDSERSAARKGQVGTGDRSERIRTYNYPQGRVTDHRINLTLYQLDKVLAGEALDELDRRADHRPPGDAARGGNRMSAAVAEIRRAARERKLAATSPTRRSTRACSWRMSSGCAPSDLALHDENEVDRRWRGSLRNWRAGAPRGEPVARIVGEKEFYGLASRSGRRRSCRVRTPRRWSTRCWRTPTCAADGRAAPHPRSRHRQRRDPAGAAGRAAQRQRRRRRSLARARSPSRVPTRAATVSCSARAFRRRRLGGRRRRTIRRRRRQSALYRDGEIAALAG